ncbi:MAG: hypothetical protein RL708_2149 [Bacteroidota bacterium]|jgi:hypothetical protein
MFLDNFKDAFNGIIEKVKNPFGGTFIAVWIIHNWDFVYSLFNFDKDCERVDKLYIIENYIYTRGYCDLFWTPILWTFIGILFYLLFSYLSLAIFTAAERLIKSRILSIDSKKIVSKERHNDLKEALENANKKIAEIEKSLNDKRNENDDLSKVIEEIQSSSSATVETLKSTNQALNEQNKTEREKFESLFDIKKITGKWQCILPDGNNYEVEITDDFTWKERYPNQQDFSGVFHIDNFYVNYLKNNVILLKRRNNFINTKDRISNASNYYYLSLNIEEQNFEKGFNELKGMESCEFGTWPFLMKRK